LELRAKAKNLDRVPEGENGEEKWPRGQGGPSLEALVSRGLKTTYGGKEWSKEILFGKIARWGNAGGGKASEEQTMPAAVPERKGKKGAGSFDREHREGGGGVNGITGKNQNKPKERTFGNGDRGPRPDWAGSVQSSDKSAWNHPQKTSHES